MDGFWAIKGSGARPLDYDSFFDLKPAGGRGALLSSVDRVSIPVGALAGGWLVYEPLLNLAHLRGPGSGDEVAAIGASVGAAALALAASVLNSACESGPSYTEKRWLWRGVGTAGGLSLGAAVVGLDLITTGGLGTMLGSAIAAKLGVGAVFGLGGALVGEGGHQRNSKKKCRNCGERSNCCERICRICGRVFDIDQSWCERSAEAAASSMGDHISLRDLVSIFDCFDLNYLEFCAALEANANAWAPHPPPPYSISKHKFFKWLAVHPHPERIYRGKRPSEDFWILAEKAVRSECAPDQELRLSDIGNGQRA